MSFVNRRNTRMSYSSIDEFNDSWLSEMSIRTKNTDMYTPLNLNIKAYIKDGYKVNDLGGGLKKSDGSSVISYWYQLGDEIALATEIEKKAHGLVVNATGKNPKYKGQPPFASALYNAILDDNHRAIRLMSGALLSDEGYGIWRELFRAGHNVSVYNNKNPTQTFQTFKSQDEMDAKFGDHPDMEQWQFVLTESYESLMETAGYFNTRRIQELSGLILND